MEQHEKASQYIPKLILELIKDRLSEIGYDWNMQEINNEVLSYNEDIEDLIKDIDFWKNLISEVQE